MRSHHPASIAAVVVLPILLAFLGSNNKLTHAQTSQSLAVNGNAPLPAKPREQSDQSILYSAKIPWQVRLKNERGSHICGGTIIHNRVIVTAAHCFDNGICRGDALALCRVVVGDRILSVQEPSEHELTIAKVIIHPSYNKNTSYNDIALIITASEIPLNGDSIKLALLPKDLALPYASHDAIATGWGDMAEGDDENSDMLRAVSFTVRSQDECKAVLRRDRFTDAMLCAYHVGKEMCHGDSGGPLAVRQSHGRFTLIGITSWGEGCARPNTPGVYTRMTSFVDWIIKEMRDHKLEFDQNTRLVSAAKRGDVEAMRHLIVAEFADVNSQPSALVGAATAGHESAVVFLLFEFHAGSVTDWENSLFAAASKGHWNVVKTLVRAYTDVNMSNRFGWTNLMHAAWHGNVEALDYLLSRGANLEARSMSGRTSLMITAQEGRLEAVKFLVTKARANINARDNDGRTVLKAAMLSPASNDEVRNFLRSRGAEE